MLLIRHVSVHAGSKALMFHPSKTKQNQQHRVLIEHYCVFCFFFFGTKWSTFWNNENYSAHLLACHPWALGDYGVTAVGGCPDWEKKVNADKMLTNKHSE